MLTENYSCLTTNIFTKTEADDEIDEIARKIRAANDAKMAQMRNVPVFNALQLTTPTNPPPPQVVSDDYASKQGHFGWQEFGKIIIPYIERRDGKYVSMRMAESKLFIGEYRNRFTNEISDCFQIKKLRATEAEAKLLNEINFNHCDFSYGTLAFTAGDLIAPLEDIIEAEEFYRFCYNRLVKKVIETNQRCGFVRIGDQNLVPFVKEFVPLFYFEGECKYLEERASDLSGWDLYYLKFACKVQGIRKVLFDKDTIPVVTLDLVKKFFLPGTQFQEYWPDTNDVSHLLKPQPETTSTPTTAQARRPPAQPTRAAAVQPPPPNPRPGNQYYNVQAPARNQALARNQAPVRNNHPQSHVRNNPPPSYYTQPFPAPVVPPQSGQNNMVTPKYIRIPERGHNPNDVPPYFCQKLTLDNKTLSYCINLEPFNPTNMLVTLEEVAATLFGIPVSTLFKSITAMCLDIYVPNRLQTELLYSYRVYPTKGLIRVNSLAEFLPQIKYILLST